MDWNKTCREWGHSAPQGGTCPSQSRSLQRMQLWKARSLSYGIRCPTGMVEHLPGLQCRLRHLPAPCPWACLARCWPLLRGGRRRPPAHDCLQAQPRPRIVGDAREPAAQLDHAGQLPPVLTGLADRMGGFFIDGEHGRSLDPSAWMEQADVLRQTRRKGVQNATCIGCRPTAWRVLVLAVDAELFRHLASSFGLGQPDRLAAASGPGLTAGRAELHCRWV